MHSLSHARFARQGWGLLLVLLLSGCSVQKPLPSRAVEPSPQQEIKALLSQPYIDPLTNYLKQHRRDASRRSVLERVAVEREQRCAQVAQRYARYETTGAVLSRYRAGYEYSCPRQVKAFAEQVAQADAARQAQSLSSSASDDVTAAAPVTLGGNAAANECYLLAQIRNHVDAISACGVPARAGDLKAQRALAESLAVLQHFDEARSWLLQAARRDDVQAQLRLAEMSLNTQAGTADPAQAWAWFLQAGSVDQAASLEAGLTPQQRQLALQRVRQQLDVGH